MTTAAASDKESQQMGMAGQPMESGYIPPEQKAEGLDTVVLGITIRDWGYVLGLFACLYVLLGMMYWAFLEIGVQTRDTDYKSLPGELCLGDTCIDVYGGFSRDEYYPALGSPLEKEEVLYPWIKYKFCPKLATPTAYDGESETITPGFTCNPLCNEAESTELSQKSKIFARDDDKACSTECTTSATLCLNP